MPTILVWLELNESSHGERERQTDRQTEKRTGTKDLSVDMKRSPQTLEIAQGLVGERQPELHTPEQSNICFWT